MTVAGAADGAKNRGRLQAQGADIAEPAPSFSWAQPDPILKADAHNGLLQVRGACTQGQLSRREEAFEQAETFIDNGPYATPPPVTRSFFNRNLPRRFRNSRVDIEIWTGMAFK